MAPPVTAADPARRRYELLAPVYDWASAERPLYARARAEAAELLRLRPGARVLDIACGTGRNFPLIEREIGPSGRLVAVDRSPRMLRRARARVAGQGWDNITVLERDVTSLSPAHFEELGLLARGARFDAVLCTLGLSVIPDWQGTLRMMAGMVRPGGRLAVMDGCYPARAGGADELVALRPLAWLLCRMFAADCRREPWELVRAGTDDAAVKHYSLGYVAVGAGTPRHDGHLAQPSP
ncbi:class I SAM-dependent methyltransferase [Streptomyces sp. MZ04]|uniref:class I SAM-dependent methyltransferase n=1 Tax=Streptomyces sp. MZ04 TaxID=2559236 RepID=UPI00107EDF96|nr:class I SAM-dependent methyltransferase [Streptomyces sp. MZ04]TGB15105.1 class I SAM-dependent methyltransferase [Streptomyces sp. MZ04]